MSPTIHHATDFFFLIRWQLQSECLNTHNDVTVQLYILIQLYVSYVLMWMLITDWFYKHWRVDVQIPRAWIWSKIWFFLHLSFVSARSMATTIKLFTRNWIELEWTQLFYLHVSCKNSGDTNSRQNTGHWSQYQHQTNHHPLKNNIDNTFILLYI